ncbi:hypothetical protein D3C85_1577740 [compost metagenome]
MRFAKVRLQTVIGRVQAIETGPERPGVFKRQPFGQVAGGSGQDCQLHAQGVGHRRGVGALIRFRIGTMGVEPQDLAIECAGSKAGGHDGRIKPSGDLDQ